MTTLKELRHRLKRPKVNGVIKTEHVDDSREVIVQVYKGIHPEVGMPWYEYHKVKTAGMLFFDGEFKIVIAAYPYDGESDED